MNEIRCAIEYREDETRQSPGRIVGTLIAYGERAKDRAEKFAPGSLHWPDTGIVLNEQHNRQAPIMRFTPALDGKELRIDAALPDTQRGRDAATMIKNGTMTGLSIEFRSELEGRSDGVREIRRAHLAAAALVDSPSYGTSVEVRGKGRGLATGGANAMAITLTVQQLSLEMRVGDTAAETELVTRRLAYSEVAIERHLGAAVYASTPDVVLNEATIRLCSYLYDSPTSTGGLAFANAMRFSGAARMLLPYRLHKVSSTGEAVSIVNDAVGDAGNPVVNVAVDAAAGTLLVVFADGTSRAEDLPAGTGGLRQIGSETLTIATTYEWIATALPAPQTDTAGVSVASLPDGGETGIQLFRAAQLTGSAAAGSDATADLDRMFALETAADGTVLFASKEAGAHTIFLYEASA